MLDFPNGDLDLPLPPPPLPSGFLSGLPSPSLSFAFLFVVRVGVLVAAGHELSGRRSGGGGRRVAVVQDDEGDDADADREDEREPALACARAAQRHQEAEHHEAHAEGLEEDHRVPAEREERVGEPVGTIDLEPAMLDQSVARDRDDEDDLEHRDDAVALGEEAQEEQAGERREAEVEDVGGVDRAVDAEPHRDRGRFTHPACEEMEERCETGAEDEHSERAHVRAEGLLGEDGRDDDGEPEGDEADRGGQRMEHLHAAERRDVEQDLDALHEPRLGRRRGWRHGERRIRRRQCRAHRSDLQASMPCWSMAAPVCRCRTRSSTPAVRRRS